MEEASCSQALVLLGNFNHSNISWKGSRAGHRQSRRSLECIDGNCLTQVIKKLMRGDALLNLILTNKEELVGDVEAGGGLGCSGHEMMEFRILRAENRAKSRITALDIKRADFMDLLRRTP